MKPKVKLISGLHITATDKRNIVACIDFQRDKAPETWGKNWLGLQNSPKSYGVEPDPEKPGRYKVAIRANYRSDTGEKRAQISAVVVQVENLEPLPHPLYATQDMFADVSRELQT